MKNQSIGFIIGFLSVSRPVYASHYGQNWSKINQYSPVENFEAQGSYGWKLGVGVWNSKSSSATQNSEGSTLESAIPERIPRLQINKGTAWPLDFGFSLSSVDNVKKVWQLGGHAQWTLVEAFQKPTLALRASRIETSGLRGVDSLQTDFVQLGSSYALMRFLTISLGLGHQWETWRWKDQERALSLVEESPLPQNQKRIVLSWGARLQLFSPFYALSFEQSRLTSTDFIQHLKLSIQL